MRRPYGVVFDLGDTVLDFRSFDGVAGNRRLLEFAEGTPDITAEEVQAVADELNSDIQRIRDKTMIEFGYQSFQRVLFETLGVSFKIGYRELEREFWQAATTFAPADGIFAVLDMLDKHRIKRGIVSNTAFAGSVLEEELASHNLAHRFSFLISSADYGFRKPHASIYQVAVRKMNLDPRDTWFVGDRLEYDIKGAVDCGLYPVWYNPGSQPGEVDGEYLEVKNWYQFREEVESLFGG